LPFSIAVMNYFQSHVRLNIAQTRVYDAHAGAVSSLPPSADRPGSPTTTKQGKPTMRISEKAVAFLLAVVISGTAFNTFIV
jgi:hypothetical protein